MYLSFRYPSGIILFYVFLYASSELYQRSSLSACDVGLLSVSRLGLTVRCSRCGRHIFADFFLKPQAVNLEMIRTDVLYKFAESTEILLVWEVKIKS